MADYARSGNQARWSRSISESNRRTRTRRPQNDNVPVLGWLMEGAIGAGRYLLPHLVLIDDDSPEYKEIVGFDGFVQTGSVTISWQSSTSGDLIYGEHVIDAGAGNNRVFMRPPNQEPFIIQNGLEMGDKIQPYLVDWDEGSAHLACWAIFRTVPI